VKSEPGRGIAAHRLQMQKRCLFCGSGRNLHAHHVFGGNGRRGLSDGCGLKVWLCTSCHGKTHENGTLAICHGSGTEEIRFDDLLHLIGQCYFEDRIGDREEFRNLFGKSYL
jgi:hypothetical protein